VRAGLLTLALLLALPAQAEDLTMNERGPLSFVLIVPTGEEAQTSSSEVIRTVADLLQRHTDFSLVNLEPEVIRECRGRLLCLVLKVRADYSREALRRPDGGFDPYEAHLEELKNRRQNYSRYLLVLSNVTRAGEPDRFRLALIDTDSALRMYHGSDRSRADWEVRLEATINEKAIDAERKEVADAEAARVYLEEAFTGRIGEVFQQTGHWEPFGGIALRGAPRGLELSVDNVLVGLTGDDPTRILHVAPGQRTVKLIGEGYRPYSAVVAVTRQQIAEHQVELVREGGSGSSIRTAAIWGGAAVATVGAVLTVMALARSDGDVVTYCIGCGGGSTFQTLGYSSEAASRFEAANPPGVLMAPLGLALAGAGGSWSIGTLLGTDEGDVPWIPLLAGLVVGAGTYALSAALNGPNPAAPGGE
jgi:hypothetical protein